MKVLPLLFGCHSLLAIHAVVAAAPDESHPSKPNIVLVMADDQGWGDMAYNGHPKVVTPHFDEAAAAGLRFDRFYAAAPVCSPTRASVMTGRTPNRMGVFKWGYPMRPQETTVAEALKSEGYVTAHFGKWHLGSVRHGSPASPGANGFDHWVSAPNFYENDPILSVEGTARKFEGESSVVTVDLALDWMGAVAKEDKPFFAVVWFGSPHAPHLAVAEDRDHYADQPKNVQNFLGEITGMDRAFGKLRRKLGALGIRDNTVLWYCSDNGALPRVGSTGGHRGHKGNVYDGGLLVPAILEWPARIAEPRTTDMRCTTSDILPTLLEIAGAKIGADRELDGVSLVPLIDGEAKARSKPLGFWDAARGGISTPSAKWMGELLDAQKNGGDLKPHQASLDAAKLPAPPHPADSFPGHAAWIDGDWKLHRVENKNGGTKWELYNLAEDPAEEKDLAGNEPERVKEMRGDLEEWLKSVVRSLNGEEY